MRRAEKLWPALILSFGRKLNGCCGGGVQPRWRRDGKELFYISPDWTMMAVRVNTSTIFQAGTPQPPFDTQMVETGIRTGPMSWDIAPDGKKFLIISDESRDTSSVNVILNWQRAVRPRFFQGRQGSNRKPGTSDAESRK
jgi:hypothetical protein